MRLARVLAAVLLLGLGAAAPAQPRPLVSVLGTCAVLLPNTYPADSTAWFDPQRHPQVVFYAHLLFPTHDEAAPPDSLPGPWHAPMAWPHHEPGAPAAGAAVEDAHYVEAEWLDPQGKRVALHGMTLSARIRSDWLDVNGREYIPHTYAMAIGTRDLRADAGQVMLPAQPGQYTVQLKVDHRPTGLAFFRILQRANLRAEPTPAVPAPRAPLAPGVSPSVETR